jgi:hypothetical protein
MLLAILLAAAPSPDVVDLAQKAQLKELCEALRAQPSERDLDPAQVAEARKAAQARREEAAARWYRVEVPSRGFALGRYRAQDQQLELDGDYPLRAIDDMLSLDLDAVSAICPNCKELHESPDPNIGKVYRGRGCQECKYTGYKGRMGLYEMLVIDDAIRSLILERAPATAIAEAACRRGMHTLREDGWLKVASGNTTVDEIVRVTQEDDVENI